MIPIGSLDQFVQRTRIQPRLYSLVNSAQTEDGGGRGDERFERLSSEGNHRLKVHQVT